MFFLEDINIGVLEGTKYVYWYYLGCSKGVIILLIPPFLIFEFHIMDRFDDFAIWMQTHIYSHKKSYNLLSALI